MRRRLLIVLLGLGAFSGFAAGFASVHHHRCHAGWGRWHHEEFEQHVADVCADAALRAQRK